MPTTRFTRSSVLGKRRAETNQTPSAASTKTVDQQLATPESPSNPKRPRTSLTLNEGDANKENVPPFNCEAVNEPSLSARAARALRRTSTTFAVPTTPQSQTLRRNASTSSLVPATPAAPISRIALATPPPTPPTTLLPTYARARALLRATCNNSSIPIAGRDAERTIIRTFITDNSTSSLYISGSPGTGKTALVNTILQEFDDQVKIININCMALKNVDELWRQLAEELDTNGKRKASARSKKAKGREAIESLLVARKTKCILVLDELDHVASGATALTTIFSLPSSANFRLIGIANTHTLTSSVSTLSDGANVQTLHFSPYTPSQLLEILSSRLQTLCDDSPEGQAERKKFLPHPTLMLLTKKVASMTGDVRSLLEVLRGAIDLAVAAAVKKSPQSDEENPMNANAPSVTPSHILEALKAHAPIAKSSSATSTTAGSTSEVISKVNSMGIQARLVLLSIILASKRVEANLPLAEVTASSAFSTPTKSPTKRSHSLPTPSSSNSGLETSSLYTFYSQCLMRSDAGLFNPVSRGEFTDLLGLLEGVGLISSIGSLSCLSVASTPSKTGRRNFGRTASFGGMGKSQGSGGTVQLVEGVRLDEVLRGLGVNNANNETTNDDVDPREEEVRIIWTRETTKIAKDVKAVERLRLSMAGIDPFGDAMED
ncbi:Origin Recognition Complex 1/Cell Division Control Protein 6 [Pleurotus pulmonarius]